MCPAQSGQMPSSVHSSSAGSGCCHRNRERSVHYNAVHGIHHTPDHQEHMVSPQPVVEGGGENRRQYFRAKDWGPAGS